MDTRSGQGGGSDALTAQTVILQSWLLDRALPLWWEAGADHTGGGFFESLDQDGRPTSGPRRARVQARQTYVYAMAGRLGWTGPWRAAMHHGLDYLRDRYTRPDGLFRTRVGADGSPADETATLYDQAFALLALATVRQTTPESADLTVAARVLLERVEAAFRHDGIGLREAARDRPFQSNAQMHLLEAALAWSEIDPDPVWSRLADRLVALALTGFIDPGSGAVRESFDAAWGRGPDLDGRIVEPGHQFEWAWLLQRWGRARGATDACAAAMRLLRIGLTAGVDRRRGVAFNALLDDLAPHDLSARLWPQTEWIKACARLARDAPDEAERHELRREAARGVEALRLYLQTRVAGLWRDTLQDSGTFIEEPAPASSFYHIVCAIAELGTDVHPDAHRLAPPAGVANLAG